MSSIYFYKYQASGNDFVLIDNRDQVIKNLHKNKIQRICNRHYGIGANGFILLQKHLKGDFEMIYYNADGTRAFCGNGSRCIIHLAKKLKIIKDKAVFWSNGKEYQCLIDENGEISCKLNPVKSIQHFKNGLVTSLALEELLTNKAGMILNTGNLHYIQFVEQLKNYSVKMKGFKLRETLKKFKQNANINFVALQSEGTLLVRTYEKGVEGETQSCGSGVVASVLASYELKLMAKKYLSARKKLKNQEIYQKAKFIYEALEKINSSAHVQTLGGILQVKFTKKGCGFEDIQLTGPTQKVFEGKICF